MREASNLLAKTEQQQAAGKVDSLAREADRLRQEENAQAGRINKIAGQDDASGSSDLEGMLARRRELNQLAQDRQQLSDSLSNLGKNVRDAARSAASNQPGVAKGLRDALTEMDNSDLDNRVQRSADWLRRGVNPNSNGTEEQIAQGLDKLSQQLHQAQQGMAQQTPGREGAGQDEAAMLNQVERLRSQIESQIESQRAAGARQGRDNGNGQPGRQSGQQRQNAQNGLALGQGSGAVGSTRAGGNPTNGPLTRGQAGDRDAGTPSGDVRNGGGGATDGTAWNNINTGNNRYSNPKQGSVAGGASGSPADTEGEYLQGMRELNQLRQMVTDDPQAAKDIAELTRQMQRLDPSRFPGNPAIVEEMHREILNSVNRLELQLQRDGASQARTGDADAVPQGYRDSVADYYRRLSKNQ